MKSGIVHALRLFVSLLLAVGLISATALAGRYPAAGTQTFTFADGTTSLGDGTVIGSNNGIASVRSNMLRLTDRGTTNTNSSFKLPDLDAGRSMIAWDASFGVRMEKRTFEPAADGWALNIGPIPDGNGDGEGGFAMAGGLVIAFDTYDNPRIQIFANGISVGSYTQSFSYGSTMRSVAVHWDADGLDLTYNSATICTNLPTPGFSPVAGYRFAFTGRTGGYRQTTYIDDLVISTTAQAPLDTGGPVISEFSADNEEMIEDENGDSSDWIEIFNGKATPADLTGWMLVDVAGAAGGWVFPSVTVPAYGYLVVFASSKNRSDPAYPLHTDFSLAKESGYLALAKPDGTVVSQFNYGAQAADVSYGFLGDGGGLTYGYLETPTPGAANYGLQAAGPPAEEVVYLKDGVVATGGLFSTAFSLTIQAPLAAGAVVRYTVDNTPPTASSPVYASPLAVSATTTVRARVFAPDRLPGPVASRTFLLLDGTLTNYHGSGQAFSSNLPIIVLDSFSVPVDSYTTEGQRPFRLTYATVIDRNPLAASPDTDRALITGPADFQGRCGTHVRGETSATFPQRSYSWEIWDNDNEDKDASILGMPAESDWVLHAPYTDKTLMRNFLVFDQMRALNGTAAAMGVKFVEVFFNQDGGPLSEADYRGVYVLMEKIKRGGDRVNIEKLTDAMTDPSLISGGYLFRKDKPDPGVITFNTTTYAQQFQFVEPELPNTAQRSWLNSYMNNFEAALASANFANPATGYAAYINPLSFVDNQWFVEITKQIDGYRLSTYFHKDRNGKVSCAPVWDYNLSLFNANYNTGDNHIGWYYSVLGSADYYYWPRLLEDPNYKILHWDRYWELRRGAFKSTSILNYIDGLAGQLVNGSTTPVTNSMANQAPLAENPAMRHYRKWPVLTTYLWPNPANYAGRWKFWNGPTLTPTAYTAADGEVDAMKSFLIQRLAWIDDQNTVGGTIYRPPVLSLTGGSVEAGTELTISAYTGTAPLGYSYASGGTLYYTTDDSDPRSSTGAAVGTAYSAPLVLNNSATVKARLLANGNWSPLATASFIVDAVPASPANLVVSEFCYKPTPPAPGTPEYLAGYISGNNFEYVELLNVSSGNVDLTNCRIAGGITFSFADVSQAKLTLPPGGRVLVVGNEDAFTMRHGSSLAGRILGTFSGNLSNSGEMFTLYAANNSVIASVAYGIAEPWPLAAQTSGCSLVLSQPMPNATYEALDFRASAQPGGTPGAAEILEATVTLGSLAQVSNGDPRAATAVTTPAGLSVSISYDGSPTPPTLSGSYQVVATVTDPAYVGSATGTLWIYDHASPLVAGTTLDLGTIRAGYDAPVLSAGSMVSNEPGTRLNLKGVSSPAGLVSLTSLAGILPGQSGSIAARLEVGRQVGIIDEAITCVFADDSELAGADADLGSSEFRVTGQIYSGDMSWSGPPGSWGDPARWDDLTAPGVHAAPGLAGAFPGLDRATFGVPGAIALDGALPSLNRIAFTVGGHTLEQGSGGTGLVMAGSNPALSCAGANLIRVPVTLASDLAVILPGGSDVLTLQGNLSDAGAGKGLTLAGAGTLVLDGANTYGGLTTVEGGTLAGSGTVAGGLAVGASGVINPGTVGEIGTFAAGATVIAGTLACDIGPTASDRLEVGGPLDLGGAVLAFNPIGVPTAAGYVVATYTGAAPAFASVVNLPDGYRLDYTQAGAIRLLKADGYETWTTAMGLDGSNNGPLQSPAGDGVPNLLKYVLNGDPLVSNPSILPTSALDGDGNLVFTYFRRAESKLDTTQVVQYSSDLVSWSSVTVPATSGGMVVVEPNTPGPGLERVTVSVPRAGNPRMYGRLGVSQ